MFTLPCVESVKKSDKVLTLDGLFRTFLKRKEAFMMRSVQCSAVIIVKTPPLSNQNDMFSFYTMI